MSIFTDFCNETEALLLSSYHNQQTNNTESSQTLNNHFINLFLKRFLPPTIQIGSGYLVDHLGAKSTNQNIILYRTDFPIFPTTTESKIFLMESVIATIEILPSSVTRKGIAFQVRECYAHLTQPFKNSASVKNLKTGSHRILANNSLDYMELSLRIKPKTFLFSFESPFDYQSINYHYGQAKQKTNSVVPNGICFLGKNGLYAKYDPESRITNFYYDEPFRRFFNHLFQLLVGEINSNNLKSENNASIIYDLSHYLRTSQSFSIS